MATGFTLEELGDAAGRSLGTAQRTLTADLPTAPTRMAIAETTLELKVAVSGGSRDGLRLHTIAPEQVRKGTVDTAALSTVTMRFAALAAPAATNVDSDPEIESRIRELREEIKAQGLDALGDLHVAVNLKPTVTFTDARGRIVREQPLRRGGVD